MARAFRASASARVVVIPAACNWRTTGSTLPAKPSAADRVASAHFACATARTVSFCAMPGPWGCQERAGAAALFDHLVSAGEQCRRHRESDRLGDLEVEHEVE